MLHPLQPSHRPTPADHAAEMRGRAFYATDPVARAYWLWLAEEWQKTADRDRLWPPPPRSWAAE